MILSSFTDSGLVCSFGPRFAMLFDYLRTHDLCEAAAGRIELDGDRLFLTVTDAEMVSRERQRLEFHRRYIDVHVPLSATETIGWRSIHDLTQLSQPYDEGLDYGFYSDFASTYVDVCVGEFFVAFPSDAHAPLIGRGPLRKVIAKILVAP